MGKVMVLSSSPYDIIDSLISWKKRLEKPVLSAISSAAEECFDAENEWDAIRQVCGSHHLLMHVLICLSIPNMIGSAPELDNIDD